MAQGQRIFDEQRAAARALCACLAKDQVLDHKALQDQGIRFDVDAKTRTTKILRRIP